MSRDAPNRLHTISATLLGASLLALVGVITTFTAPPVALISSAAIVIAYCIRGIGKTGKPFNAYAWVAIALFVLSAATFIIWLPNT